MRWCWSVLVCCDFYFLLWYILDLHFLHHKLGPIALPMSEEH